MPADASISNGRESPGDGVAASEHRRTDPTATWLVAAGLIASIAVLAAVWITPYIPTHDGPQHIYLAHVENHYSDPGSPYATYYNPGVPLTALGFGLIYAPLESVLPWAVALRIALSVILLFWAWGYAALVHAVQPRRSALGLLGFAAAFQWAFYMGFFSYLAGTALGFFVLAVALKDTDWTWKRRVVIAVLLTAQAMFHVFTAEATALVLILIVLAAGPVRGWLRGLGLLALMGLPTFLLALYGAGVLGGRTIVLPEMNAEAIWLSSWEKAAFIARGFVSGPSWRAWPLVAIAAGGLAWAARNARRGRLEATDRAIALGSAALLALGTFLPLHLPQWQWVSPRFLPLGAMLGAAVFPLEKLEARWARGAAYAVLAVVTGTSLAWAGWYHLGLDQCTAEARAGLSADMHRDGPRLPIVLRTNCEPRTAGADRAIPYSEPLMNLGALYAVQQGGIVPYTFTSVPQLHSFVFSESGWAKFPRPPVRQVVWVGLMDPGVRARDEDRSALLEELALRGSRYEDIVFYGERSDRESLARRGFVTDWEGGEVWIAHFEGCEAIVEIDTGSAPLLPLMVEYAWPSEREPSWRTSVPATAPRGADGIVRVTLTGTPCGPIMVRVLLDRDDSGGATPGDVFCAGASAMGIMPAVVARHGARLACRLKE